MEQPEKQIKMTKQRLLTGWNFMRLMRLGIGVFFAIQAIQMHDGLIGVIAALLLFQVASNTGCCGANVCEVSSRKKPSDKTYDVSFEEIKTK